jgi:hypothetical protein
LARILILPLVLTVHICVSENSPSPEGTEAGIRHPVVILLGWGGCRDKNLAKYSAIYHKRVSTAGCANQLWWWWWLVVVVVVVVVVELPPVGFSVAVLWGTLSLWLSHL